ncbi:glycine amidinotransferase, mitochondrial-like [Mytilus galloprovincialis]|uniref:glycine amidinotransferase, mitochondrial-like n=1 Tax=Mytilus galloprovincialis TaxID=29158 RepID=UPI003F7B9971
MADNTNCYLPTRIGNYEFTAIDKTTWMSATILTVTCLQAKAKRNTGPFVLPTNERKGILVNPPDRPITKEDKDRIFTGSSWEILDAPFPNSMVVPESCKSSAWLSINLLMVGPDKAIVEESEIPTINFLESLGIKCIRVPYRDSYRFGGSIHCQTSDVRRIGECHSYFPNMDSNENQTTTNS